MTTDQVNPEPADVTTELYKAVIGPRNQDYYLHRFSRFDADGKKRVTWHWPAFWSTLNWLVYKRMWGWALGFSAVSTALALAIFGLGRLVFNYSDSVAIVLVALFLLASFVLPGLFANAAYYRFCKRKIAQAVAASSSMQAAYEQLAHEAGTKKRVVILALINVTVLALIAAAASLLPNLNQAAKKLTLTTKAKQAPTATARKAKPAGEPAVAKPAAAPASAPAASAGTAVSTRGTSSLQPPSAAASKPAPSNKAQQPAAVDIALKPLQLAKPAIAPDTEAGAARVSDQPAPKANAGADQAERRYFLQVGAFADEAHVREARAKVESTGLTPFTQPVETPAGRLTRVRVGPFDSRTEARKAAAQIQATGLAALLLHL